MAPPRPRATTRSTARSSTPSEPGAVSSRSASSRAPTTAGAARARRRRGRRGGGAASSRASGRRGRRRSSGSRRDQPARSRPGAGGRSSGQPRHSQPRVTTPSGRPQQPGELRRGEQRDPAHAEALGAGGEPQVLDRRRRSDHRSASGKVARPRTPAAGGAPVAADDDAQRCLADALELQVEQPAAGVGLELGGLAQPLAVGHHGGRGRGSPGRATTRNRHGWLCPTEGAAWAAVRTRSRTSSGTGSGR